MQKHCLTTAYLVGTSKTNITKPSDNKTPKQQLIKTTNLSCKK